MDKANINYGILDELETVEVCGKNGDKILVKKRISYKEKEEMAQELASSDFLFDDESDVCHLNYKYPLLRVYLIAKYYTNIDVNDIENEDDYRRLFDYITWNELYDQVYDVICSDFEGFVREVSWRLSDSAKAIHETVTSLGYKIMQTFDFLFTGEDIVQQIASAEGINEKMIDAFKALKERENLSGGKGKVVSSGAVLNMSKK